MMFGTGIRLPFRLLGIPVLLDWSFLIILPLLAYIIGTQVGAIAPHLGIADPQELMRGGWPFLLGLVAALGLFASVVLHELGHAVVARLYGVKVRSITLWFLGGVARFEEMPRQRGAEAVVAVAGPLVSFALALLFAIVIGFVPPEASATRFVIGYLVFANALVAIFNLIPALPLDGGRILRSVLALFMPHLKATRISGAISKVFAVALGLLGLFSLNFFLVLIAIFIYLAVTAETSTTQMESLLRGMLVRDLMNPEVKTVSSDLRIADLMQHMLNERHLGFPVVDETGQVVGLVDVQKVQGHDPGTPIAQIMQREVPTIDQDAVAVDLFRMMMREGYGRIIALDAQGRMAGIITKTDIMRLVQLRSLVADITHASQFPPVNSDQYPYPRHGHLFPQH
jgi:Zn-dependent protease/predicted transcriptional regulator